MDFYSELEETIPRGVPGTDSAGRAGHLATIAMVFHNRHADWSDVGAWLREEFSSLLQPAGHALAAPEFPCRHSMLAGKRTALATAVAANRVDEATFPQFTRPCLSYGTGEKNKNGGLIVHSLCTSAAAYLKSIGRGDPSELTGRDYDYDEAFIHRPAFIHSSSMTTHLMEPSSSSVGAELDDLDVELEEPLPVLAQGAPPSTPPPGLNPDYEILPIVGSDLGSEDDWAELERRGTSTKVRAASLAYLCKFASDPLILKREWMALVKDEANIEILHLCGHGMSTRILPSGRWTAGCAEPTHLVRGSSRVNARHKGYHTVMHDLQDSGYADLVVATTLSQDVDCRGVF